MLNSMHKSRQFRRLIGFAIGALLVIPFQAANADATSSLVVTIKPQRAIDDGAKWRYVVNGTPSQWYASGYKIIGLDDGDIMIEAGQPQQGSPCKAPTKDILEIRPGRSHMREFDYTTPTCR
jgi:hypothetical protein